MQEKGHRKIQQDLLVLDVDNEGKEASKRTSILCVFGEEICYFGIES